MARIALLIGIWVAVSAVAAVGLLILSWPSHPHSWIDWVALVALALPALMLGEYLGDRTIFRSRLGKHLDALGPGGVASTVRVLYLLLAFILALAVIGMLIYSVAALVTSVYPAAL